MKILVVTSYNQNIKDYADITSNINKIYISLKIYYFYMY